MRCSATLKVAAVVWGCSLFLLPTFAGSTNEKLTDLPLYAGLSFDQQVNSTICGKKAQINLYDAPANSKLADYITWYKAKLPGSHYVHMIWDNRPQEAFYSADGSRGVSLTGLPHGPGVFAVAYMHMATNLTPHEMDTFNPGSGGCK